MENFKTDFLLSKHWELCYRAHSGTSFSPEKRANYYVKEYSTELQELLDQLPENKGNFQEKYENYFCNWMRAKSNCISSMITGPANFPVRKAQKANQSEHNRHTEFREWIEKYFKAVNRVHTPSPEEELEGLYEKLDKLIIENETIKDFNKSLKQFKSGKITEVMLFDKMTELGLSERTISTVKMYLHESWFKSIGSLAQSIREANERINVLKVRIERKENWEDVLFDGGRITIEDDRVKIIHDDRPDNEIIAKLKKNGWKWSPQWKAWVRKHTGQAVSNAKYILGIKPPLVQLKFEGIDSFNRAIFVSPKGKRYGDFRTMFPTNATKEDVQGRIHKEEIVYFGEYFGCEPQGTPTDPNKFELVY